MNPSTTDIKETLCARCGRARSEWRTADSQGHTLNGKTYCCEGCATGEHCTCELRQTAPRLERNTDTEKPQGDA